MRRISPLLALVLVAVVGCRTWQAADASTPVPRAIAEAPGGMVRLSSRSSHGVELRWAHVSGDSAVGHLVKRPPPGVDWRVAVALEDVISVEQRRVDAGLTALAVFGGVLGALAVWVALIMSSGGITFGG